MKHIILVTMFRTINYGSCLQTYALSKALEMVGASCQTVDYPVQAGKKKPLTLNPSPLYWLRRLIYWRRDREYNMFLEREINLTKPYYSYESLLENPPQGDIYMTGSDQTFNPRFTGGDPIYFLEFTPQDKPIKKVSYASSFATKKIPDNLITKYKEGLGNFDYLTVREESGIKLVESLTNKKAYCCCDPTLLLESETWQEFAKKAARRQKKTYILVYLLSYMVNPYPEADRLIKEVQRKMEMQVIFLNGRKEDIGKPKSRIIKDASPYEFVDLFMNASFILTSSFHGTIFSLHSGNPFLAFVNNDSDDDSRTLSFLKSIKAEKHAVPIPVIDSFSLTNPSSYRQESSYRKGIKNLRLNSFSHLKKMTSDNLA